MSLQIIIISEDRISSKKQIYYIYLKQAPQYWLRDLFREKLKTCGSCFFVVTLNKAAYNFSTVNT